MDRREAILSQLETTLAAVPGIMFVVRNRGELPSTKRPAIILLDADESARPPVPQARGRLTLAPHLVDLTPEIYVVMDQREPHNVGVGQDMNALRVSIVKAIMNDATLIATLGANGDILYNGCNTDMATGRSMEGQMMISLTFTYPLIPSEL